MKTIKYQDQSLSDEEMLLRSKKILKAAKMRHSVRTFSSQPVAKGVIENILMTASSAPSGANLEPWTFCAISNAALQVKIREAAENEEKLSYNGRMNEEWLTDLKKFDTNWEKPFLSFAPWLIVVFKQSYGIKEKKEKKQHYYVNESVGIACGFLIKAIQDCGLVTLTHTPSPMGFLSKILERPTNEKPYLLLPVGHPAKDVEVPDLSKKTAKEVIVWY